MICTSTLWKENGQNKNIVENIIYRIVVSMYEGHRGVKWRINLPMSRGHVTSFSKNWVMDFATGKQASKGWSIRNYQLNAIEFNSLNVILYRIYQFELGQEQRTEQNRTERIRNWCERCELIYVWCSRRMTYLYQDPNSGAEPWKESILRARKMWDSKKLFWLLSYDAGFRVQSNRDLARETSGDEDESDLTSNGPHD